MKTVLLPTEPHASMQSALETALLLAQKFGSCIEGFPLRPGVADLVAMDPDSGLTMVAVKENDAEMVRHAEDMFRSFMSGHQVSPYPAEAKDSPTFSWLDSAPSEQIFVAERYSSAVHFTSPRGGQSSIGDSRPTPVSESQIMIADKRSSVARASIVTRSHNLQLGEASGMPKVSTTCARHNARAKVRQSDCVGMPIF